MAESFDQTKQELVDLLQRLRHGRFSAASTPEGVTPAEGRAVHVMGKMAGRGDEVRPGAVAAAMHITPSALSQILKSLEEKGLIERHRTSGDFRAIALVLTPAGEAVAAEAERLRSMHLNDLLAYLGQEDVEHLVRTLGKVLAFHEERSAAVSAALDEAARSAADPGKPADSDGSSAAPAAGKGGAPCA